MNGSKGGSVASSIGKKEFQLMSRSTNAITGSFIDMRAKLEVLETTIKAAEKSKIEFETHLGLLNKRRDDLMRVIEESNKFAKSYETDLGPFAKKYDEITADIGSIYDVAKRKHYKGIQVLRKEFNYHPAFKRPGDTFTAIPFKPK